MIKTASLVAVCALLSGCASLPSLSGPNGSSAVAEALLKNLQGCERTYSGGLGAGVTLSVQIHCDPVASVPPT